MKKFIVLLTALYSVLTFANDPKNEWHNTTLSDETVKKIQQSQFEYKKCVSNEMQKSEYQKIDFRKASEEIVKQCENVLADIETVYRDAEVPETVAKRHSKQLRIKTIRSVLNTMMLSEAARNQSNK